MAAQADTTLNTVVYSAAGVLGQLATWIARGTGIPSAYSTLTSVVTAPSPQGKVYKVTFKLSLPVVADATTSCQCVGDVLRVLNAEVTFLLPVTSTTAERTDFLARVKAFLAGSYTTNAVQDLNQVS